jgi:hypothetical protein
VAVAGAGAVAALDALPASVVVVAGAGLVLVLVEVDGSGEVLVDVVAGGVVGDVPVPVVDTAGREIWSSGTPGGASTCTVTVWPPSKVTVMVRSSADAGKTAAPNPAVKAPADTSPMRSLRRLMKRGRPPRRPGQQ